MKKTDVLVIGSSAAGVVAATTGKRINPDKDFTMVTMQPKTLIPCGIPYIFGSVESSDKNILPAEKMCETTGVNVIHDEVMEIDRENKICKLKSGEEVSFSKLVIGTGSLPNKPKWLKGAELENVFTVPKNKIYIDAMQSELKNCQKIVVIGAGFIGVEMSDELKKAGKEVVLVEKLSHILGLAFDEDVAMRAQTALAERGVDIRTGVGVKEVIGNSKAEGVLLDNGETVAADAVVLAMGYRPNADLAKKSGLLLNENGFIKVDEYMRTADIDYFAIGDCAEKKDFFTRKTTPIMLASTACAEARIAAMNLFQLSAIKTFGGTISIFATALGKHAFGVAGLTETLAIKEGFDIVTGEFEGVDRHPGNLEDSHKQFVKLIVGKQSGVVLGAEVAGGLSTGEFTNMLGIIVQNKINLNALLTSQIGTHPLLTASPAAYVLIKAAENAAAKIMVCR